MEQGNGAGSEEMTDFKERPTELVYDHLSAGDEGYWPIIGAVPDEIQVGDRVSFTGDEHGHVVTEVHRKGLPSWPCRIGYTDQNGKLWTVGRMAGRIAGDPKFHLDRWGNHGELGFYVR